MSGRTFSYMSKRSLPLYSNTEMQTAYRQGREDERERIAAAVREKIVHIEGMDTDLYSENHLKSALLGIRAVLAIVEDADPSCCSPERPHDGLPMDGRRHYGVIGGARANVEGEA